MRKTLSALLTISAVMAFSMSPAPAADLLGELFHKGKDATCTDPGLLKSIKKRFSIQAERVYGDPDWAIVDVRNVRENRYDPATDELADPIARRYCIADAVFEDGNDRTMWYLIEYGQGFASIGNKVEFCVSGADRWKIYNNRCRVLR